MYKAKSSSLDMLVIALSRTYLCCLISFFYVLLSLMTLFFMDYQAVLRDLRIKRGEPFVLLFNKSY